MRPFKKMRHRRNRVLYAGLIAVVVFIGLSSRKFPQMFPGFVATYAGDTLWAMNVFLLLCFFFPKITGFALRSSRWHFHF